MAGLRTRGALCAGILAGFYAAAWQAAAGLMTDMYSDQSSHVKRSASLKTRVKKASLCMATFPFCVHWRYSIQQRRQKDRLEALTTATHATAQALQSVGVPAFLESAGLPLFCMQ